MKAGNSTLAFQLRKAFEQKLSELRKHDFDLSLLGSLVALELGELVEQKKEASAREERAKVEEHDLKPWFPKRVRDLVGYTDQVTDASFSPDGKYIFTNSYEQGGKAIIWEAGTGKFVLELKGPDAAITKASWSPQSDFILTTSDGYTQTVWSLPDGKPLHTRGYLPNDAHSLSPDGKNLVAIPDDKTLQVVEAKTGRALFKLPLPTAKANSFTKWSQSGHLLAVYGTWVDSFELWDTRSKTRLFQLTPSLQRIQTLKFSPNDRWLAGIVKDWGLSPKVNSVILWNNQTGKERRIFSGKNGEILDVAFSSDSKLMAIAEGDMVNVYEIPAGRLVVSFEDLAPVAHLASIAFSQDGQYLVTGSKTQPNKVWDLNDPANTKTLVSQGRQPKGIKSAEFAPGGRLVIIKDWAGIMSLWDARTGTEVSLVTKKDDWLKSIAVSPDGRQVVSGSASGQVTVWEQE
jgi:WD40 repeat protein